MQDIDQWLLNLRHPAKSNEKLVFAVSQCQVRKLCCQCGTGLQSRRNFGECSVFSQRKSWPRSLMLTVAEGQREKEICTKGAVDGQKYVGRQGCGSEDYRVFSPFPHPLPPIQIKDGWSDNCFISDRELVTLAHPEGMPAIQVSAVQKYTASFQLHVRKNNSTHNEKSFLPQNSPRTFSPAYTCSSYYLMPALKLIFLPCISDNLVPFSAGLN